MKDHLSLMGIQRWQLRSISESTASKAIEVKAIELDQVQVLEGSKKEQVVQENTAVIDREVDKGVEQEVLASSSISNEDAFSAYAATSLRMDAMGKESRWLWVVPQVTLPSGELQLLDKIVAATSSSWESSSLADSYLTKQQLDTELQKSLSAIVVLGHITRGDNDSWEQFFKHDAYMTKRFFIGVSLQEMNMDPDKKRLVWKSLQGLM